MEVGSPEDPVEVEPVANRDVADLEDIQVVEACLLEVPCRSVQEPCPAAQGKDKVRGGWDIPAAACHGADASWDDGVDQRDRHDPCAVGNQDEEGKALPSRIPLPPSLLPSLPPPHTILHLPLDPPLPIPRRRLAPPRLPNPRRNSPRSPGKKNRRKFQ